IQVLHAGGTKHHPVGKSTGQVRYLREDPWDRIASVGIGHDIVSEDVARWQLDASARPLRAADVWDRKRLEPELRECRDELHSRELPRLICWLEVNGERCTRVRAERDREYLPHKVHRRNPLTVVVDDHLRLDLRDDLAGQIAEPRAMHRSRGTDDVHRSGMLRPVLAGTRLHGDDAETGDGELEVHGFPPSTEPSMTEKRPQAAGERASVEPLRIRSR